MDEWSVVLVLSGVVGLFCSIGIPIIRFNATVVKLSTQLEHITTHQAKAETDNTEGHRRIWKHNDEQDDAIRDHETRITILERK